MEAQVCLTLLLDHCSVPLTTLQDIVWHPPHLGGALGLHGHRLSVLQYHLHVEGMAPVLLSMRQLLLDPKVGWLDSTLLRACTRASCLPAQAFSSAAEPHDAARLAQCPALEPACPAGHTELLTCVHLHASLSCYVALAPPGLPWRGRGVHVLWSESD